MQTNNKFNPLMALLMMIFLISACASPQKMIESGNYDAAINAAVRKMSGKKIKKEKFVFALEDAFEKATRRDLNRAERLKKESRPENWEKINDIYRTIRRRQEQIEPLLPLVAKNGIKANFKFVRIDAMEVEAKEKAAAYLYDHAQELLQYAEKGDMSCGREAYYELEKINKYYRDYKDVKTLKYKARELGTTHIFFEMQNRAPVVLPRGFERELMRITLSNLNNDWKVFHSRKDPNTDYNYKVVMNLTSIDVSPEMVKEREFQETKEIEDGFDYVLDENGNVTKDTAGNDIKVARIVQIHAWVLESLQTKAARVGGELEFFDLYHNELLERKHLEVEALFENYASTFKGDKRALSKEARRHIGNRPVPFPSNESLLLEAAAQLKPIIKQKITASRQIF